MPNRYIEVPEAVTLFDPITNKAITEQDGKYASWDFALVINKLMSNPMWGESFAAMRSQEAIYQSLADIRDGIMTLAEDDWQRLKQAVELPKTTVNTTMGAQAIQGFGLHPSLARQIVPLLTPIMDAKAEKPKPKVIPVTEAPAAAPTADVVS